MGGAEEARGETRGTLTEIARGSRSGAPFAGVPALPGRLRRRLPLGAEAEAAVG
jgi:hypothetical protein